MVDLAMTTAGMDDSSLSVGYTCPCGCTPAVTYRRGQPAATEGCCCGNEFAVGPNASARLSRRQGFVIQSATVWAPWAEVVPVVWAIGPSTHPEDHAHGESAITETSIDPVCGMTIVQETAMGKGLHVRHQGVDYSFCGKGCKLDFQDDPTIYLAPGYVPSM